MIHVCIHNVVTLELSRVTTISSSEGLVRSPFFHRMFTGDWSESSANQVSLDSEKLGSDFTWGWLANVGMDIFSQLCTTPLLVDD